MTNIPESAKDAARSVLAKCAANDPWFPQPAQFTLLAWAEQFAGAGIELPDLLAGVTLVYRDNGSGFKPLPADIIKAARALRADRAAREDDAARRERELAIDTKAADQIHSLSAAFTGPTKNRTDRLIKAELGLQCATGKTEVMAAMREWTAAKRAAAGKATA